MAAKSINGIHHVTAICSDPQQNIDFYTGVLGLRLVKLTVNFDDPGNYHLYYGDNSGRPGTIMTFFAWPGASRGRIGPPQVTRTAFSVPADSMEYWSRRLGDRGLDSVTRERFGEPVLAFSDPDSLELELVGADAPVGSAEEYTIRGFHGVTLSEEDHEATVELLTGVMGYEAMGHEQNRHRFRAGGKGIAPYVDILGASDARRGAMGAGVVHHVAFATPDDTQQAAWRESLVTGGFNVSPVMDRCYFHSIYFREPGGVLFEIATEDPGFAVDEPAERLGSGLRLPPWMESRRAEIEKALPQVQLPDQA